MQWVLHDPSRSEQLFNLRNVAQLRDLEHNGGKKYRPLEKLDNGSRLALIGTMVGQENGVPCEFCASNKGHIARCIVVLGFFQGSCTNCHPTSRNYSRICTCRLPKALHDISGEGKNGKLFENGRFKAGGKFNDFRKKATGEKGDGKEEQENSNTEEESGVEMELDIEMESEAGEESELEKGSDVEDDLEANEEGSNGEGQMRKGPTRKNKWRGIQPAWYGVDSHSGI